ncbi:glycoside hydrolase family 3 N-terminal domain-containing protein [Anaeromassilibacillus senegalensis]|uniref:glycoside hydrolase family 3 N-terminal domain-containing protein n=1 Tax=Anaeromassilibacillus senegalensis TaxID=1673717 RepID=UPI00093F7FC2|nr:glycoside hydrolase family 3 N-terminal domain-containing protein [Anaeromassilibacillus senegalensis]
MKRLSKSILSLALASSMLASMCATSAFAASPDDTVSEREVQNAALARKAGAQGMVLLENKNAALPIKASGKIALFGGGAYGTVKGGTGSGDVNQRYVVNVWDGLKNAGYEITSEDWLSDYKAAYDEAKANSGGGIMSTFVFPDREITDENLQAASDTDTAIYVIARNSGEGKDRTATKGDYYLDDTEYANLEKLGKSFEKVIVVINSGGIIDTKFFNEIEGLDSMLLMSQAGMEGGNAVTDVLTGKVTPSGKLTDTWAVDYEDYPSSETFSSNDDNVVYEEYEDGIYVGYRYFDTFNVTPAYEFGYGSSYTTFDTKINFVEADATTVTVNATIKNTGDTYSGKEVFEVYFSAPDGKLEKPYQELAGFAKTDELAPGASQDLTVSFPVTEMSSYDEETASYILEAGDYVIRGGNSSRNTHVGGVVRIGETKTTEQLSSQLGLPEGRELNEISKKDVTPYSYEGEAAEIAAAQVFNIAAADIAFENNASAYDDETVITYRVEGEEKEDAQFDNNHPVVEETVKAIPDANLKDVYDGTISMEEFVAQMSVEQLADLAEGIGWGSGGTPIVGSQSDSVPGAAGETTKTLLDSMGVPNIVLSDGPAGIRITQSFDGTNAETGETQKYYQFCTAWPIGTLLAQTWDKDLIEEVGDGFGIEMQEMGVTLLLAPGMNIHRNPLCGRNFEYYSEDPLVAGMSAAAITLGVQSNKGVGVTLKHYAANNQENNRNAVDTFVSERALREIYLKGFEMAVKNAQPMSIMTSYNLINSVPAADSYDLCTDFARGEWGFEGVIMTDWGGGQSDPGQSMHAGNDLIMPGGSASTIVAAATKVPAQYNEDGSIYVKESSGWWGPTKQEMWNDWVPVEYAEGESCTFVANCPETKYKHTHVYVEPEENSLAKYPGTFKIQYEGSWKDDYITKGDIQKSAMNVLNIVMQSNNMGSVHGVDIKSYTEQFDNLKDYVTVEKSKISGVGSYTVTKMDEANGGYYLVENDGGATLGMMNIDMLITDKGYAFKDLNGNGKLDTYEDWRLDTETRAQSLAEMMVNDGEEGIAAIAGLMLYSSHQAVNSEDLTAAQEKFLKEDNVRHVLVTSLKTPEIAAKWNNNAQAFVEGLGYGIPVNNSSDPRHGASGKSDVEYTAGQGGTISLWPDSIGLAATFDPDIVETFGDIASQEYRALGIATALSPQIDLATEPRWSRVSGTFGENSDLDTDMARAYVDGFQTTYDSENPWGAASVNAMVKHWPSGGPEEGGRDGHYGYGKYAVYPGNNLKEQIKPFVEGAFNLNNGTEYATAVMPYYTISYNQAAQGGEPENTGNSYNKYIITDLLREKYGYDGVVCTDWMITADSTSDAVFQGKCWGVEDLTVNERHYMALQAGVDQFGGNNDKMPVLAAYDMWVENFGKEAADQRFEDSARRLLRNVFNPGLFENPYLDPVESAEIVGNEDFMEEGYNAQLKSVVMLKNADNAIVPAADDKKETVYLPYELNNKGEKVYCMNKDIVSKYYNVTENPDEADFAIVGMSAPKGGSGYSTADLAAGGNGYVPITLQYGEYTADTARAQSIASDPGAEFINSTTGEVVYVDNADNRSYKGKTVTASNGSELVRLQNAKEAMGDKPVIVYMKLSNPMVWSEVEPLADAIVLGYGIQDQAAMEIISGTTEPSGLLPMQQPKNMETVEAQYEDVPQDMECYVDAAGNTYDFGYGLNWNGQIYDDRTEKYADVSSAEPSEHMLTVRYVGKVNLFIDGEEQTIANLIGAYKDVVMAGEELELTFAPRVEGREIVLVNGKPVELNEDGTYTYTFTMPNAVANVSLNFTVVDRQILRSVVATAQDLQMSDEYKTAVKPVKDQFDEALEAAEKVLADPKATQKDIDKAWADMIDAIHYLSFAEGDKTILDALFADYELLNPDDYTADSWAAAEAAYEAALEVYNDDNVLAADVEKAYDDLYEAMTDLLNNRKADFESLINVINEAKAIKDNLDKYYDTGVEDFLAALEEAEALLDTDAAQSKVNAAADKLANAMNVLRLIPDTSALEAIIEEMENADTSNSSAAAISKLEDTLKQAKDGLASGTLDQAGVDKLVAAGRTAMNGLGDKGNTSSGGKKTSNTTASNSNSYGSAGTAIVGAAASTQAAASVVSDTTVNFTLKRGSAYCFKMTVVNGANLTPSFTVGNGSVLKTQFVAKIGNDYYYRVWATGAPGTSTGVYTTLAGQAAQQHCTVTIG